MDNLDAEYELFKSLCQSKSIDYSSENEQIITNIKSKGLKIDRIGDKFCINDTIIALCENKIRNALSLEINELIQTLDILYQTRSTNDEIIRKQTANRYTILLTEFQTNGQGRRGKKWVSPLAENIYLSIQFQLRDLRNIHFIPLLTGISICKALKKTGIYGCQIKWPNDIYLEGKKLAGILVESRYNSTKGSSIVVGIGLNVNMQSSNEIEQSWTSLRIYQKKSLDRNIILRALLSESLQAYNKINHLNLKEFMNEWHLLDCLYGCQITVSDATKTYSAIAQGIADDGALLVKRPNDNKLKKIYSADVSIKADAPKKRERLE